MSTEIEAKVLNSLVRDRYLLIQVMGDGLLPDVFRDLNLRIIFKTVTEMSHIPDQVIDWITIEEHLKKQGRFTPEVGRVLGAAREDDGVDADQVMAYVEILKDQSLRDKLYKLSQLMAGYAMRKGPHKDHDFLDFSNRTIQTLIEMQKQKSHKRLLPVRETISEIRDLTNQEKDGEKTLLGFSIHPHERLEHVLSGIRKGFYYGLAGPPRRGKTTLALDIASRLAENNNFPVLFYTWEQTRRTLAARLLGRECYMNPVRLLTEVSPEEKKRHALVQKVIERSRAYSDNLFVIEAGRTDTLDRIKGVQHHARIPVRQHSHIPRLSPENTSPAAVRGHPRPSE